MKIPSRYSNIQNTNLVFALIKILYGLKQSSRAWFGEFSQVMKNY